MGGNGTGDRPPKPDLAWDARYASVRPSTASPELHQALRFAIAYRRLIRYADSAHEEHTAEPHIYGTRGGIDALLVYQPGASDPWQLLTVSDLADVEVLDDTYPGARPLPSEFDPDRQRTKPRVDR